MNRKSITPLILLLLIAAPPAHAELKTGMVADVVIGQPDFTSNTANNGGRSASSMNRPQGVWVAGGKLFVTDKGNSRVLIFNQIPTTNGAAADVVVGQADMASGSANPGGRGANTLSGPNTLWTDGKRLIIADGGNARVLIFNRIPTENNASADVVVGAPDFTSAAGGCTANRLDNDSPQGVFSDGKRLLVAGWDNARVLIFNSIPTANFASADVVVGQKDFTSCTANQGGSAAANTLSNTIVLPSIAGDRLFIPDAGNNRVLIWNRIPTENNAPADIVIGQPNFTTTSAGTTAAKLNRPRLVFSDGKRLFVFEPPNRRVVVYNTILTHNNASADIVIGQKDFVTGSANQGGSVRANTLNGGYGIFSDGKRLIVADTDNHRVLIFNIGTPAIDLSPQFNQGKAVLGKVFWDWNSDGIQNSGAVPSKARDGNGRQDSEAQSKGLKPSSIRQPEAAAQIRPKDPDVILSEAKDPALDPSATPGSPPQDDDALEEKGIEGVRVISDTGIYAITDHEGKYHFPFIETGQRLLKLDPSTLPEGAITTTESPRKVTVTEGILTKVSFGIRHPEPPKAAKDPALDPSAMPGKPPQDDGPLLHVSISQDPTRLKPHLAITAEEKTDKLVFRIDTNYSRFIDRGEIILYDEDYTPTRTIPLSKPIPSQYTIPITVHDNRKILYYQLRVFDVQGHEDRTGVGMVELDE